MNVTFNELSYRILNIIVPKLGDDASIDISEVKYDVENTRAMLIKQRYSNKFKSTISDSITQFIPKLEIEDVNASIAIPELPSGKVLMKTKLKIPEFIDKSSGLPLIKRISSATILSHNFTYVTQEQAIYSGNGKFNQKNIFVFRENDYLYLITGRLLNKGIKYIDLNAVFQRPTKVNEFLTTNSGFSFDDDSVYPINMDMIGEVEDYIVKSKLRIESSQPIDDINDSSDTAKQIIK